MSSSPSPAPLNLKRTASTSPDDSQKHKRRSSNPLPLLTPSPTDPACSTTLYIYSQMESEWKSACCIPLEELRDLSKRPAKWLRYIGWCLYGAPGTLHLSEDPASLEIPSNAGAVPDTDILADRTSAAESRKGKFRKRLLRRDRRCVFMQASHMHKYRMVRRADCDAAHIVPHSKGRQYIEILEDMHGVRPSDKLQGIDDPRNGLMLSHPLHRSAGKGECAFLLASRYCLGVINPYIGDTGPKSLHGRRGRSRGRFQPRTS
ncbi:hypothetical protein B0H13DRAFT_2125696 [Mycena leptocephala]|nr:hypothetical protein B0H13DRAFT_2125696 [Mycena leptocephala]